MNEFFHALNNVLVELDGSYRSFGDGGHLGLGYGRLHLVERGHLLVELLHGLHGHLDAYNSQIFRWNL